MFSLRCCWDDGEVFWSFMHGIAPREPLTPPDTPRVWGALSQRTPLCWVDLLRKSPCRTRAFTADCRQPPAPPWRAARGAPHLLRRRASGFFSAWTASKTPLPACRRGAGRCPHPELRPPSALRAPGLRPDSGRLPHQAAAWTGLRPTPVALCGSSATPPDGLREHLARLPLSGLVMPAVCYRRD